MKVFLDDDHVNRRPPGPDWIEVRKVSTMVSLLETGKVTEISLDNDLGPGMREGRHVVTWIEKRVFNDKKFEPPIIHVHSANPVARRNMEESNMSIQRMMEQRR